MSDYIRVDDHAALVWLQTLIGTSVRSPGAAARENYAHVLAWEKYLANPVKTKDVATEVEDLEALLTEKDFKVHGPKPARRGRPPSTKKKVKPVRKPKVVEEIDDPYSCKDHPDVKGVQAPRKDCDKCWSVYKLLHPQTYATKRRQFELKQKEL